MLNVWVGMVDDFRACRAVIAVHAKHFDQPAQRWAAQAEPSSIFMAAKLAVMRRWKISKVGVKAAFLNAPISPDELEALLTPQTGSSRAARAARRTAGPLIARSS